jgi:hypothetical protein
MPEKNPGTESEKFDAAFAGLRSENILTQNEGVEAAIRLGVPAVPALLAMLKESGVNRAQAMYALARIGDPRAEEAFVSGVRDADERVRAYAAQGLVHITSPGAMTACLETLNDAPDELHLDITPSVRALGEMGLSAVPSLLDLLTHDDEMTRLHAQRALELILEHRHGFIEGRNKPSKERDETVRREWQANGDYDYSADAGTRAAAVAKWRLWLAKALAREKE